MLDMTVHSFGAYITLVFLFFKILLFFDFLKFIT